MPSDYIPILVLLGVVVGFATVVIVLTHLIGPKKPEPEKLDTYECGVPLYTKVPNRFSVKFFLVAVLFVLFDIEAIFLYPWAIVFKSLLAAFGPFIFFEMLIFLGILFVGLIYVWRRGALEWE